MVLHVRDKLEQFFLIPDNFLIPWSPDPQTTQSDWFVRLRRLMPRCQRASNNIYCHFFRVVEFALINNAVTARTENFAFVDDQLVCLDNAQTSENRMVIQVVEELRPNWLSTSRYSIASSLSPSFNVVSMYVKSFLTSTRHDDISVASLPMSPTPSISSASFLHVSLSRIYTNKWTPKMDIQKLRPFWLSILVHFGQQKWSL